MQSTFCVLKQICQSFRVVKQQHILLRWLKWHLTWWIVGTPLVTGYKSPVTKSNLSNWLYQCNKIVSYLFEMKDEPGHFLREKHCKTVIWGFVFSICSVMGITQDMLTCTDCPLKYLLTYKFSQDCIELLFNKIRCRGGWNNNPNVLGWNMHWKIFWSEKVLNPQIQAVLNVSRLSMWIQWFTQFYYKEKPVQRSFNRNSTGLRFG